MKHKLLLALLLITSNLVQAQSPYISKVFDYRPAPGQFVNLLPEYEAGDNHESMIRKVEEYIAGDEKIPVTLGGYGGYVVFGFDHPVVNVPGDYDFKIWGNAFLPDVNAGADKKSGSSEPGIVLVAYDANGNGIPDDEWYELAGSEYAQPETIHNYRISYYKPDADHTPTPDLEQTFLSDTTYIKWIDNQEHQGYLFKNTFHKQAYYPAWIADAELTFEGSKLADNFQKNETGMYIQSAYDWGYADNHTNDSEFSNFKLEWAIDKAGNKVHLPEVHFFKVYTAVNQYCGILGETSTEITGAEDLHPGAVASIKNPHTESIRLLNNPVKNQMTIVSSVRQIVNIYNLYGVKRGAFPVESGTNVLPCNLQQGIYILQTSDTIIKFIKH
jgi:hypothetical protein